MKRGCRILYCDELWSSIVEPETFINMLYTMCIVCCCGCLGLKIELIEKAHGRNDVRRPLVDTAPPFGTIVMHCFLGLALTLGHGTQGGCDE